MGSYFDVSGLSWVSTTQLWWKSAVPGPLQDPTLGRWARWEALAPYPQGRRARVLDHPRGPHFRSAIGWVHQGTLELASNGLVGRREHFRLGLGDYG